MLHLVGDRGLVLAVGWFVEFGAAFILAALAGVAQLYSP